MHRLPLLFPVLLLTACGEKAVAPAPAPVEAASAASSEPTPDTPSDAASRAFAKRLLSTPVSDFRPGEGGVDFVYRSLTFRGDNSFVAEARMSFDGESIDCTETGTWTMDAASGDGQASMTWAMTKTTCAGRPANVDTRVQLTADGGGWKVEVR
jgi:hypothetical protein